MSQYFCMRNVLVRFENSDFESLRAFVNYDFVTGFWLKVLVGALIGATVGLVAGLAARVADRFGPGDLAGSAGRE